MVKAPGSMSMFFNRGGVNQFFMVEELIHPRYSITILPWQCIAVLFPLSEIQPLNRIPK